MVDCSDILLLECSSDPVFSYFQETQDHYYIHDQHSIVTASLFSIHLLLMQSPRLIMIWIKYLC